MWIFLLFLVLTGEVGTSETNNIFNHESAPIQDTVDGETTMGPVNRTLSVPEVPKCCPLGESLIREDPEKKSTCVMTNLSFDPEFWAPYGTPPPKPEVKLLIGERCKYDSYRLEPNADSQDEFRIMANGFLHVPFQSDKPISPYDYCLESFVMEDGNVTVLPLVCFPPTPPSDLWKDVASVLYPIGCLVSVPFLLVTALIFLLVEELRDVQGKILACYSLCLAVAYLCLAAVQMYGEKMQSDICVVTAFMIQFFFVACFFWLNVMCYHTWRKMKNDVFNKQKRQQKDGRLFAYYSFYGWGFPLLILFVTLYMDLMPTIPPSYIKPNFGIDACWFQNDSATLSYFYGPISILLAINVVFFVLTIKYLHLNSSKDPLIHLQDVAKRVMINRRRHLFIQCIMLFCVMGMTWILEVLSWKFGNEPAQLWIIMDGVNTLQGVIVLLVFVVRDDRVRTLLSRAVRKRRQRRPPNMEAAEPLNSRV